MNEPKAEVGSGVIADGPEFRALLERHEGVQSLDEVVQLVRRSKSVDAAEPQRVIHAFARAVLRSKILNSVMLPANVPREVTCGRVPTSTRLTDDSGKFVVTFEGPEGEGFDLALFSCMLLVPWVENAFRRMAQVQVQHVEAQQARIREIEHLNVDVAKRREELVEQMAVALRAAEQENMSLRAELARRDAAAKRPLVLADVQAIEDEAVRLTQYWSKDNVATEFVRRNLRSFMDRTFGNGAQT